MKLKFKQQQYQDDAVKSIVDCFKGQEKASRKDIIARYTKILKQRKGDKAFINIL